jgi:serine protease inhibitor
MKPYVIFFFSLILVVFSSCEKQESKVTKDPIQLTSEQQQIVSSTNKFGFNIFRKVNESSETGQNVFVSPLSISLALSMLFNGAEGTTRSEIQTVLGYDSLTTDQINQANKDLIKSLLEVDPKVIMEIANSIWYRTGFSVEPDFLTVNQRFLNAEVKESDFGPATKSLINSWVSDKTHGKIKTIIDGDIPDAMVMYLINAIYFKGVWKYQFDSKNNVMLDFNLPSNSTVSSEFMYQKGTFQYTQNDLFTAVNLPYGSENFSMFIMLPKTGKTCSDIISAMNDENWNNWNKALVSNADLKIYLPKFKFSFKSTLNDNLKDLGLKKIFDDNAELTKISKQERLFVSEILHKTFVEVNEEGTEAAAVTSIGIYTTSVPVSNEFKADKPFIFVIKEKDTNTLLFMGTLNKPVIEN